jgi:hypothetical protein
VQLGDKRAKNGFELGIKRTVKRSVFVGYDNAEYGGACIKIAIGDTEIQ